MPAVLVELDFICNPTQEKFMASDRGAAKLARAIANAVIAYQKEQSVTDSKTPPEKGKVKSAPSRPAKPEKPVTAEHVKEASATAIIYKVQFLTSGSTVLTDSDPRLKGITPVEHYRDTDGIVKYTTGATETLAEAKKILSTVKQTFPQAFIIKTLNGQRVR